MEYDRCVFYGHPTDTGYTVVELWDVISEIFRFWMSRG